jgi:hypothetical protein
MFRYTKQQMLLIFVFFVVIPVLLLSLFPFAFQYIQSDTPKPLYNDTPPPRVFPTTAPKQPIINKDIISSLKHFTQTILP